MKRARYFNLFVILCAIGFYLYHVREFGAKSLTTILSLASCVSFLAFFFLFIRVGRGRV